MSPGSVVDHEGVDVDARVGSERARDHRALRVDLGFLPGELSATDQLADQRVVVRQLLELAVAER